ncbi:methylenetetrahydrofolate reductase C-terminal domain-containing protein [Dactylosporangium sp. NPDC049140]|uniref:methylenetetrahydrofolate reductase C-terminal domain-containing protein n=1 Tax=Dactylosporangium sp. NPDC049140 TaxID=3155647 RepID=UPI0033EBDB7C
MANIVSAAWEVARAACPKHMAHGPCAGVSDSGMCEVPSFGPCPYTGAWPFPIALEPAARRESARPFVLTDLPAAPLDAASLRASARILSGSADAFLLGDHGAERVQFPPSYRARLLADEGVAAWPGVNCRDRNRVALEGELAACADAGAAGVHCVTGDHPALGHRPDAMPVFDLDSTDLTALARREGLRVSVAHAPASPPAGLRLPRLLTKVAAGADVVVVDHCGGAEPVQRAVDALRGAGFAGTVLACVPVATDAVSADVLAGFAAGRLPPGYLAGLFEAPDQRVAGIDAAISLARELLAHPGVDGVNLSAGTRAGHELATARDLATIGRELRP